MERFWHALAVAALVSACGSSQGGNPFAKETNADDPEMAITAELTRDLQGVTYDPVNKTLTVRGVVGDDEAVEAVYRRRPNMDRGGYEAYTQQDASLQPHATAYVKDIDGHRAAIVVTGGQFSYYVGGSVYEREGAFDPPGPNSPSGVVSYAGNYVGLLNGPGDGGDLLSVAPGTPIDARPREAGEVTGRVLINADFTENNVRGRVFDRVYVDGSSGGVALNNIDLAPTTITADGTFSGDVTVNLEDRGGYGGVFGGTDAAVIAGTLFAENHMDGYDNEEEFGLFVIPKCGTANDDALCDQPAQ